MESKPAVEPGSTASQKSIFVVDDERLLLDLGAALLRPRGYEVRTFINPAQAVATFQNAQPRPDLIITDYSMPEMTGMDLLAAVRAGHAQQRVRLVSGTAGPEVFSDHPEKPDAFLNKPYLVDHFIAVVSQILQKKD